MCHRPLVSIKFHEAYFGSRLWVSYYNYKKIVIRKAERKIYLYGVTPITRDTFKTRKKKKFPGYKCSVHENEKFKGWGTICSSLAQGFSLTWWCKKRLLCSLKLYWINLKNNNKKGNFNTNTTDQTNLCHPQHNPYFSFTSWTLMPLDRRRFISPMAVSWDISFRLYFVLEVNIDTALI